MADPIKAENVNPIPDTDGYAESRPLPWLNSFTVRNGVIFVLISQILPPLNAAECGTYLAPRRGMSLAEVICQHCEGILLSNKAYRVWTEDSGRVLLDMVVCYACNLEAQKLGLKSDEIKMIATTSLK